MPVWLNLCRLVENRKLLLSISPLALHRPPSLMGIDQVLQRASDLIGQQGSRRMSM